MAKPKKGVTPKALKPYLFKPGHKTVAKKRTKKAKKRAKQDTRFGVIFG